MLDKIKDYLAHCNRNKVVVCREEIDGLSFVNLGYALATKLQNASQPIRGFALLSEVFNGAVSHHPTLGDCLALDNVDILFEPALQTVIRHLLCESSKNQCLIIRVGTASEALLLASLGDIPHLLI